VAEEGRHEDLMQRSPTYRKLYELQFDTGGHSSGQAG
jgi:ABC-type multidrug transport system fused ATPase/permease subunit